MSRFRKDDLERLESGNVLANDGDEQAKANGNGQPDYGGAYSEVSFWKKMTAFAVTAGGEVVFRALVLYYCLCDPDTPKWARTRILGALGYFIFPADAIPDIVPIVGYADDLGALALALAAVALHIKPEHEGKAEEKLKTWFAGATSEALDAS